MFRSRSPRRFGAVMIAAALVALGLSACLPPPSGTPARITTEPPLFPEFQTDVLDYVSGVTRTRRRGAHDQPDRHVRVGRGALLRGAACLASGSPSGSANSSRCG